MLKDKKVLLCVTGGIAAYKAIDLASMLYKSGAEIRTVMTDNACQFVTPLNFAAITHQKVYTNQWDIDTPIAHIELSDWADIVVVAPATANIIAKVAHGIADDLVSSTLLACTKPLLFVPAMNVHMYTNIATQTNMQILNDRGYYVLEPDTGALACGYAGIGKYPDNNEVLAAIDTYCLFNKNWIGKKVLVTAGATEEDIDPMRYISNRSSGKMGIAIVRALKLRGADVTLIHGSMKVTIPSSISTIYTQSAKLMYQEVLKIASEFDFIFMVAAVSDYTPAEPQKHKIKKGADLSMNLMRTADILESLGKAKPPRQRLIGFAAETENIENYAREKLQRKNLDYIVANNLSVCGQDETSAIVISPNDIREIHGNKLLVANQLLDLVR